MAKLRNIHPGEILLTEFLMPLELSASKLAKHLGVSQARISRIVNEKSKITPDTAMRLSKYFGNSTAFWLGIQEDFELRASGHLPHIPVKPGKPSKKTHYY